MLFSSRKLEHASPSSCTRVCRERVRFKVDANTETRASVDLNNPDHDMHVEKEAHCRRDGGGITGITTLALFLVAMQLL